MAKRDTVAAITAGNGAALDENAYMQSQLDQLLPLAQRGADGQADFDAKKAEIDAAIAEAKAQLETKATADKAAADQAEADRLATEQKAQEAQMAEQSDAPATRKVRVNYASPDVNEGTAFIHPESRTVILGKLVSVPDDEWTQNFLAQRFLTEK